MAKARSLVGLDGQATKIVASVLDVETGQLQAFSMGGEIERAAAFCAGWPGPVRAVYEAGPDRVRAGARAGEASRGGAARPGPRPGGGAGGSDALPPQGLQAAVGSRDPVL